MIELKKVNKAFGTRRVLIDYDLHVEPGETFVIMGASGIGKSVTLKHIVGLLRPDSGSVTVNGVDVVSASRSELADIRHRIGYLFQGGALLNWMTVGENIALPLREDRFKKRSRADIENVVRDKLSLVNLSSEYYKYPSEISGGMRKRAAMARVLVTEPEIILYDEPTAGLDPRMASTITELIRDVNVTSDRTAIVVTHDLKHAYNVADRIGLMYFGRLLEVGTPEEIQASENKTVRDFIEGRPIRSADEETKLGIHLP